MATDAENLQLAITQTVNRIVEVTASAAPDYSENGRTLSRGAYLEQLTRQLQTLREAMALADYGDAWELRTRGVP